MAGPTEAGYLAFIRDTMRIDADELPDNSPWIPASYSLAIALVNKALQAVVSGSSTQPSFYALAVYNLAGHTLIEYAPDEAGSTYFTTLREKTNMAGMVSGVVQSSGDEGSNTSMLVPEQFGQLTLADIQLTKTAWGQRYLGMAQAYGPSIWGLS